MTAHTSVHDEPRRPSQKLLELGLPSFWLLAGILAVLLSLVGFVALLVSWS